MKIIYKTIFVLSVIILSLYLYSLVTIKNDVHIIYINKIPGKIMAMTIPPLGIFIEREYQNEPIMPGSILSHEKIHWLQYQERGLFKFYFEYISGLIKYGRFYNDLEKDARKRSMEKL